MYFLLDGDLTDPEVDEANKERRELRELQEQRRWDTSFARLVQAERLRHL